MDANIFLNNVIETCFRDNCKVEIAIIKAKNKLMLSDKEFELIKYELKSKLLRRELPWNI